MECPKCNKNVSVLVTAEQGKSVRDRRGILLWIFLFPFMLIYKLFRVSFFGRKTKYDKPQHWRCSYCGHTWPQKFDNE